MRDRIMHQYKTGHCVLIYEAICRYESTSYPQFYLVCKEERKLEENSKSDYLNRGAIGFMLTELQIMALSEYNEI